MEIVIDTRNIKIKRNCKHHTYTYTHIYYVSPHQQSGEKYRNLYQQNMNPSHINYPIMTYKEEKTPVLVYYIILYGVFPPIRIMSP